MHVVESPRPLHGAGAEHERRVRALRIHGVLPVQRERMRRGPGCDVRAVVGDLLCHVDGRRRQMDETTRPRAVVEVLVPFVAQRVGRQGRRGAGRHRGERRVAPEAQRAHFCGNLDREGAAVDRPDRAGQAVLWTSAIGRRAEARVAPRAGPFRRRVDLGVVERFLVADECAIRLRAELARLPARFPEHFVAAEERQVDAAVACRFDVRALIARPVLVVAHREIRLMRLDQRARAIGVDAREVADVVPVGFEPADHRVFGVEQPALRIVVARIERAVVADLRGARGARILGGGVHERTVAIEARAAKVVVRLPRRIGRLEQDVGCARIVANDEDDVTRTRAGGHEPRQLRQVDARRLARRRPRRRRRPVAAVYEACRRRLADVAVRLRERAREIARLDFARSEATVVAQAKDLYPKTRRVSLDLEPDGLPLVDADVGSVSLDGAVVAGRTEVPVGVAGKTILLNHRVGRTAAGLRVHGDAVRAASSEEQRGADRNRGDEPQPGGPGDLTRLCRSHHQLPKKNCSRSREAKCRQRVTSALECGW